MDMGMEVSSHIHRTSHFSFLDKDCIQISQVSIQVKSFSTVNSPLPSAMSSNEFIRSLLGHLDRWFIILNYAYRLACEVNYKPEKMGFWWL